MTRLLAAVLLFGSFVTLYARSLDYPFVNWDDPLHVYRNPAILEPAKLSLSERWLPRQLGYPMPVTMLSYRLDAALHLGPAPVKLDEGRGFHLTNLLLALALVALAWRLATILLRHRGAALMATLLFALHPLLVEPVVWISGRKDLLAAVFSLAALLSWLAFLRHRRVWQAAGCALLGIVALLSKPNAVYLLPLAGYLLWAYRPEESAPAASRRGLLPGGVLVLLLLAAVGLSSALISYRWNLEVGGLRADLGPASILRRALWALGYHLGLVLSPTELRVKYIVAPGAASLFDLMGVVTLVAASVVLWRARRRAGPAAVGVALFVTSYLPVSNLVPLQRFVADTYMLLPLLGLAIAAGALLRWLSSERSPALATAGFVAAGLLVLMLAAISWRQVGVWSDSVSLWRQAMRFHSNQPKICRMLGHAHSEAGSPRRAIALYRRCSARMGLGPFANNLAINYYLIGAHEDAARLFRWILQRRPNDARAKKYLRMIDNARGREL